MENNFDNTKKNKVKGDYFTRYKGFLSIFNIIYALFLLFGSLVSLKPALNCLITGQSLLYGIIYTPIFIFSIFISILLLIKLKLGCKLAIILNYFDVIATALVVLLCFIIFLLDSYFGLHFLSRSQFGSIFGFSVNSVGSLIIVLIICPRVIRYYSDVLYSMKWFLTNFFIEI